MIDKVSMEKISSRNTGSETPSFPLSRTGISFQYLLSA